MRANWLLNFRGKLQRVFAREARANPVIQADAVAFVSALMRIG